MVADPISDPISKQYREYYSFADRDFFIRFVRAGMRLVAGAWAHDAGRIIKSKKALLRSLLALLIIILLYRLALFFL